MEARKFVLAVKPTGLPKTSDFAIEKEALKPLEDGGNNLLILNSTKGVILIRKSHKSSSCRDLVQGRVAHSRPIYERTHRINESW